MDKDALPLPIPEEPARHLPASACDAYALGWREGWIAGWQAAHEKNFTQEGEG